MIAPLMRQRLPTCERYLIKRQSAVSCTAVTMHPDISFAISTLSQFLDNLGELHWDAVKYILRYLSGM
jgi:hypothetical protein